MKKITMHIALALAVAMGTPSVGFADDQKALSDEEMRKAAAAAIEKQNEADTAINLTVPEEKPLYKSVPFWVGMLGVAAGGTLVGLATGKYGPEGIHQAGTCPTLACAQAGVDKAKAADAMLWTGVGAAVAGIATAAWGAVSTHNYNQWVASVKRSRFAKANNSRSN